MSLEKISYFKIYEFISTYGFQETMEKRLKSSDAIFVENEDKILIFDKSGEIEIKLMQDSIKLKNKNYNINYNLLEEEISIKYLLNNSVESTVKINTLPTVLREVACAYYAYKEAKEINKITDKKDFIEKQIYFFNKYDLGKLENKTYFDMIHTLSLIDKKDLVRHLFNKHSFNADKKDKDDFNLNMNINFLNISSNQDIMYEKNNNITTRMVKNPKINSLEINSKNKQVGHFNLFSGVESKLPAMIKNELESLDEIFKLMTEIIVAKKDFNNINKEEKVLKITQTEIDTLLLLEDKSYPLINDILTTQQNINKKRNKHNV